MKNHIKIYSSFLTTKWLWVFTLALTIGGYTNYNEPVRFEETIELLSSKEENSLYKNIVSFQPSTNQKKSNVFSYISHKNLRMLSLFHSRISLTKDKKQRSFIPLFYKQKIIRIPFHSSTVSEEEPFHFNLITG